MDNADNADNAKSGKSGEEVEGTVGLEATYVLGLEQEEGENSD